MDLFSMRVEGTRDSGVIPVYSAKDAVGGFFNDRGVFADRSVGVKGGSFNDGGVFADRSVGVKGGFFNDGGVF